MAVVLHVQGLRYRPQPNSGPALVVEGLRLEAGDRLGIEGPPGCGKSLLLDLLAMLRKPGAVYRMELLQHEIVPLWRDAQEARCDELRAIHLGIVPSRGGVLPGSSVRDNLRLSQRLLGLHDEAWIDHLLRTLGLAKDADRRLDGAPAALQTRVSVGRALAHRPALVLADGLLDALLDGVPDGASNDPRDGRPRRALDGGGAAAAQEVLDAMLDDAASLAAAVVVTGRDLRLLRERGVPVRRLLAKAESCVLEAA